MKYEAQLHKNNWTCLTFDPNSVRWFLFSHNFFFSFVKIYKGDYPSDSIKCDPTKDELPLGNHKTQPNHVLKWRDFIFAYFIDLPNNSLGIESNETQFWCKFSFAVWEFVWKSRTQQQNILKKEEKKHHLFYYGHNSKCSRFQQYTTLQK